MNHAAKVVMQEFDDIILGYGQSDEFSFVFRREAEVSFVGLHKYLISACMDFKTFNWPV